MAFRHSPYQRSNKITPISVNQALWGMKRRYSKYPVHAKNARQDAQSTYRPDCISLIIIDKQIGSAEAILPATVSTSRVSVEPD